MVWAIGYRPDYRWVRRRGLRRRRPARPTPAASPSVPGLYFLGLPWLHTWGSGRFLGIARDAEHVAGCITGVAPASGRRGRRGCGRAGHGSAPSPAHFGRDLERALAKVEGIVDDARARRVSTCWCCPTRPSAATSSDLRDPDLDDLPPALAEDAPELRRVAAAAGDMVVCVGYAEQCRRRRGSTTPRSASPATACSAGTARCTSRPASRSSTPPATGSPPSTPRSAGWGCSSTTTRPSPRPPAPWPCDGAEVLACLSAWPASVTDRASRLPQDRQSRLFDLYDCARAAENQVVWVSSNQTGVMGGLRFLGQAKVVGPGGDVLARTSAKGGLAVAERRRRRRGRPRPGGCCTTSPSSTPRRTAVTPVRVALLTYSTKPRGGVVHTLALAEALAAPGIEVDVWTLGRGGDAALLPRRRPRASRVHAVAVPRPSTDEPVGARIARSIAVLGAAFAAARSAYDVVHAQDCISAPTPPCPAVRAHRPPPRHLHHPRAGRLPRAGHRRAERAGLRLGGGRRRGARPAGA